MSEKPKSPEKVVEPVKSEAKRAETTSKLLDEIRERQNTDSNNAK